MTSTYLPLLLSSVQNCPTASDDSNIAHTHVSSQVDYLSHKWREEDVWRSWRSMTRQKNEITNGQRLENASWRTWWKQRNGLRTISPETLNWLKDSDVTWLYGPFHTAQVKGQSPLSRIASASHTLRVTTTPPSSPEYPQSQLPKSILKHRTVGELLAAALPATSTVSPDRQDLASQINDRATTPDPTPILRPALVHTRSESNILKSSAFRVVNATLQQTEAPSTSTTEASVSDASDTQRVITESPASSPEHEMVDKPPNPKRHISFNAFVEQCIAIEDGPSSRVKFASMTSPLYGANVYPQVDFEEQSEASASASDIDESVLSRNEQWAEYSDEEDDPIVLIPKQRRSSLSAVCPYRSNSLQSRDPPIPSASTSLHKSSSFGSLGQLNLKERVTIAQIAPTMLKAPPLTAKLSLQSNATGHILKSSRESLSDVHQTHVPLLWVPPSADNVEQRSTHSTPRLIDERAHHLLNNASYHSEDWESLPDRHIGDYFDGIPIEPKYDGKGKRRISVSPAETLSSTNTTSTSSGSHSGSRTRGRKGNTLLSPSPETRGRSSETRGRTQSRSASSPRESLSPANQSASNSRDTSEERRGRSRHRSPSVHRMR